MEGEYLLPSPGWAARGEETAARASARIREGGTRGDSVEMHEVGHGVHTMQTGAARVPSAALKQLGRQFSAGGARQGSAAERNELYADGLSAYLRNPRLIWERAPDAAAMFRRHVNEDAFLSRYFQLQGAAGLMMGAGGGLLGAGEGEA
ncbi:hypothetical protein GXW71_32655 [Roseomonas hellenica]|uniref:Uncharacterized protein n=1 Tax=Plastoroseomonas hellenica TaxID=2687306 RepID=A0ABS5F9D2_9PROT|nr:hypothetical protein [Plastoroseomonas hellenica]MBR0669147.1 hypothetical protein [Plastoroseomonas hellenica]